MWFVVALPVKQGEGRHGDTALNNSEAGIWWSFSYCVEHPLDLSSGIPEKTRSSSVGC